MVELFIRLAAIIMACAAIYLIVQLASLIQEQSKGYKPAARRLEQLRKNRRIEVDPPPQGYRPAPSPRRSPSTISYSPQPTTTNFPCVRVSATHQELESQLLTMLGGNRETAIRLLKHTYHCHPERGYQWCLEKAISDLLRDRRS
jgi:hypothetical protein